MWTLALVISGLLAGASILVVTRVVATTAEGGAKALAQRTVPADAALAATIAGAVASQNAFLDAATATDATARAQAIALAQQFGAEQDSAWNRYRHLARDTPAERRLQREFLALNTKSRSAGAVVVGLSPDDPAFDTSLEAERSLSAQTQAVLANIEHRFYGSKVLNDAQAVLDNLDAVRVNALIASAIAFALFIAIGAYVIRRSMLFDRQSARDRRAQGFERRQSDLETQLQRGLEMEPTEEGSFAVVRQAIGSVAPTHPVELLVSDSSHSHFRQVIASSEAEPFACQVGAPSQCPAARSGQTRTFADSRNIDTCPYLRDKPEPVWATCVPLSMSGRTIGVLHAENRLGEPAEEHLPAELELIARKAGDRIGVLRVLAHTEAQAQVDPLTGLPNRRTLEERTRDLLTSEQPFVVAYADLDHFKNLNDMHGHDTGDRALRLFARVLRDSIRPNDIPARYGGEEFVVVLPNCSVIDARVVAERIRTQLLDALIGGSVPSFTVSIGLAEAEGGEAVSEVIDRADAALLRAKQLGRDRVLASGQLFDTTAEIPSDASDAPTEPPVRPPLS
jgi:diguanylate cyclase (GGDEF)-like protein